MATVICTMTDCVHRSKRKLKRWQFKSGQPCYGCKLESITISEIFDPDRYVEQIISKEDMARCCFYEPKEEKEEIKCG